jgi:hypothetical protein
MLPILALAAMAWMILPAGQALAQGKKIKVGFAETGAESAWRTAHTQSMKSEAEKRGNIDFKFADGLIVVRQHPTLVVDDPGIDAAQGPALAGPDTGMRATPVVQAVWPGWRKLWRHLTSKIIAGGAEG